MADKKINQFSTGSLTDSSLGVIGDPNTGALSQTGLKAMKDYFTSGSVISTGSLATTASLNAVSSSINVTIGNVFASESNYLSTSSYVIDSSSFDGRINNVFASESNYTLTSSFTTLSSSYHNDSSSFTNRIINVFASESNYTLTSSFNSLSSSYSTDSSSFNIRILNVFASESNYTSTSSFNTLSSSYSTDSASFNSRINSITGSGTGSVAGANTQIQFNNSNNFGASNNLTWNNATNTLNVSGSVIFDPGNLPVDNTIPFQIGASKILLGNTSSMNPAFIEFGRTLNLASGAFGARGSMGFLGSTEVNMTVNMDYTNGTHKYYSTSSNAIWSYMSNQTNEFGIQWVKAGHPNDDTMWTTYGAVVYKIAVLPSGSNGEAGQFGSRIFAQELWLIDSNYTSPTTTFSITNTVLTIGGAKMINLPMIRATNNTVFSDPNAIATFITSGSNTFVIFANQDSSSAFVKYRFIKNKNANYTIGAGTIVVQFDYNGGVMFSGVRGASSGNAVAGFSNLEYFWQTTNPAGSLADRMVLDENGFLGIGVATPSASLELKAATTTAASMRIRSGSAPTTPNDGDIWYNAASGSLQMRISGSTKTFVMQ